MGTHVRVPNPVYNEAKRVKDEQDYATLGEAIRHMCSEGGYNV